VIYNELVNSSSVRGTENSKLPILALFLAILGLASALEVSDLALKTDNIGGKFSETLSIEGFAEPVRSSGEFRIKGGELFWTTLEPVRSELKIGADGVFERSGEAWVKSADSLFDKDTFLAISRLDVARLSKNFSIALSGSKDAWFLHTLCNVRVGTQSSVPIRLFRM